MLLVSGNDAAIAIADYVGGTTRDFVVLMNDKAAELGLRDTHFANPHGLDDSAHYSSAYDMAMLGRAVLADPVLAAIVRTKSYEPDWDGGTLWNGNELLDLYPGTIGVKTGYTETAGQTFVAAAERDGRRLIVAILGSFDRYADAAGLFDWAFANSAPACTPEGALGGGLQ
jgi:D-alanyl-D-alanine carboxypeptidase